jgi:hypothetical protein
MKRFIGYCVLALLFLSCSFSFAGEGPIQVTGLTVDGETLSWNPNTEADLAGYFVYYSIGSTFAYLPGMDTCAIACVDVGLATEFKTLDNPDADYQALLGNGVTMAYGVAAYDTSNNRSGVTSKTGSGDDVTANFTLNPPPNAPAGLNVQ